jgi:hypothetical protein
MSQSNIGDGVGSAEPVIGTEAWFVSVFGTGGHLDMLRERNCVPSVDLAVTFYEYLVVDRETRRKLDVPIDHDTGELPDGAVVPPHGELAEHKYFWHGAPQSGSATGFVGSFFPKYDAEGNATRMSKEPKRLCVPKYDYYGIGEEQLRAEWLAEGAKSLPHCRGGHTPAAYDALADWLRTWAQCHFLEQPVPPIKDARFAQYTVEFRKASENAARNAILKQWSDNGKDATHRGRLMHRAIELCYNGAVPLGSPLLATPEMRQFARFHKYWVLPRGFEMYRTELSLAYCPSGNTDAGLLCGTIDAVFWHRTNDTFHLVDWKRSKEIKHAGFRRDDLGTGPCAGLPNCNHSKYNMQLNCYHFMFTAATGRAIASCHIAVFHPNQPDYVVYDVPNMQDRVEAAMRLHASATDLSVFCEPDNDS